MTNSAPERLETDRLVLTRPEPQHAEALLGLATDARVAATLGGVQTREAAWRGVASLIGHWALRGFGFYAVVDKASGDTCGRIGFWQPEGWPGFELGWTLAYTHWGRGLATEAARALLPVAFGHMQQQRVISLILPDNTRSIAVAQRLGMSLEGQTTISERFDVDIWALRKRDSANS